MSQAAIKIGELDLQGCSVRFAGQPRQPTTARLGRWALTVRVSGNHEQTYDIAQQFQAARRRAGAG